MISAHWSFIRDTDIPKPGAGEVVMTKAWVERGLSLPCSEFFLSILNTYGLQPHNICPNSYLLFSNFATLCEGHLGIRPDVKLWRFSSSEEGDKGQSNVPDIHDGLPKFVNEPPEELASWSFVPSLAQTPILEKAARRISCGRPAPSYPHDLPADSLKRRIKTLVKIGRGQPVPELIKDIHTNNQCPPLDTLAEENFRTILRVPVSGDAAEEVRTMKRRKRNRHPQGGPSTFEASPRKASGCGRSQRRASAKPKTIKPPANSKKAEPERLKMLSTAGKRSRPIIPGAPNPSTTATRTTSQEPITKLINLPLLPQTLLRKSFRLARRWAEKILRPKALPKMKRKYKAKERRSHFCENGAVFGGVVVFPKNFGDQVTSLPLPRRMLPSFSTTEAEKWELEQDLLNDMLKNAWGKPHAATSEI
ncbi:hypothetical protein QYE76_003532 [Lolium multiflorum]|uniref:Transposase (putative) gypsy type domain-containing protein n=1 Tax=Lolium multiflorum TaxID=4521 RepID=A0AAD8RRK8_LOLMU|nr:hypothetical protein QYE76_003532 [Lolium multiflorum]